VKRKLGWCAFIAAVGLGVLIIWKGCQFAEFGAALVGKPEDTKWVEHRYESPSGEWAAELVIESRGPGNSSRLYFEVAKQDGLERVRLCRVEAGCGAEWTSPDELVIQSSTFWDVDRSQPPGRPHIKFLQTAR
jgi:hypothetical protein